MRILRGWWVAGIAGGIVLLVAHAALASPSPGRRQSEIADYLKRFHANPKATMFSHPPRLDSRGNRVERPFSPFPTEAIRSRKFVEYKAYWRSRHRPGGEASDAEPQGFDRVENLVDRPEAIAYQLDEIEKRGLLKGEVERKPWSGDYWPFYKGLLAARYADPLFPSSKDWKANFEYVSGAGRTRGDIFATSSLEAINVLSPAEKYDLLIDVREPRRAGLTSAMWRQGREYYESAGEVAEWMGICDGWAPASFMLDRPSHAVMAVAADGQTLITFYPHDIKALASLLWAWGSYDYHAQIGARCDVEKPRTDANGRIQDSDCFDVNPASVHLAITHQLGANRAGLIMDSTYDYEVWNQPLRSYEYTYFNPQTLQPAKTLSEATVALAQFAQDKFKAYRSPKAVAVVGIAMDLAYVIEDENPKPSPSDDPSKDLSYTVRYMYDLELDSTGRIVGGEWYSNIHPDFFWRPATHARAVSVGDAMAQGDWDGSTPLPPSWVLGAERATLEGQPLARIVEQLIRMSRE